MIDLSNQLHINKMKQINPDSLSVKNAFESQTTAGASRGTIIFHAKPVGLSGIFYRNFSSAVFLLKKRTSLSIMLTLIFKNVKTTFGKFVSTPGENNHGRKNSSCATKISR